MDFEEKYNQNFAKSTKKMCESSLNVHSAGPVKMQGLGGGSLGKGLDIADLSSKLQNVNEQEELAEQKKKDFEQKRKNHYANEFQMAQLLKNK